MEIRLNRHFFISVYFVLVVCIQIVTTELKQWFEESLQCDKTNHLSAVDPTIMGGILQSAHGISVIILLALIFFFLSKTMIKKLVLVLAGFALLWITIGQFQSGSRSMERIISPEAQEYNAQICKGRIK